MSISDIHLPLATHGLNVGFPKAKPYGCDTSRMICAESDIVAYRDGKWGDYVVGESHFRIHDCTGGVYGLFTFDRHLLSIHKGYGADLDAFAHAVELMRDRSAI